MKRIEVWIVIVELVIALAIWLLSGIKPLAIFQSAQEFSAFRRADDPASALLHLERAIAFNNNNPEAHFWRGSILLDQYNDVDGAIREFEKVIELSSDSSTKMSGYVALADAYSRKGEWDFAAKAQTQAIKFYPNNEVTRLGLVELYYDAGRYEEAWSAFQEYFDTFPSTSWVTQGILATTKKRLLEKVPQKLAERNAVIPPNGFSAGFGRQYSAALTPDGAINLFYKDSQIPVFLILGSKDNGASWKVLLFVNSGVDLWNEGNLITTQAGSYFGVYTTSEGKIIYRDFTFGNAHQIELRDSFPQSLKLTLDTTDNLYLTWTDSNNIYFSTLDLTHSSSPQQIASNGSNSDIYVTTDGRVHLVYSDAEVYPGPSVEIWYMQLQGKTWSKPRNLSQDTLWSGAVAMTGTSDGTIHVVYVAGSAEVGPEIYYISSKNGANWTQPTMISSGHGDFYIPSSLPFGGKTSPSIEVDPNGDIVVAWRISVNDNLAEIVTRTRRPDGTWGDIIKQGEIHSGYYLSHLFSQSFVYRVDRSLPLYLIWGDKGEFVIKLVEE